MRKGIPLASALLALTVSSRIPAQTPHAALKKVAEFDLPGPPGKRFDYLTIDPDDHYLISAHLGAGQTYIIDHRTTKVFATVKDTPGAERVCSPGMGSRQPRTYRNAPNGPV